ncbi:hypothetical protein KO507_07490 [Gilvimarinus agarilyticus]|uniref:hypothetical protein n=1 Tax=Gilvimarinus sp. 2_MG-2023 TaxID=3062666 RepID=UPI001C099601|nr:hypothetical protein [Gilvimarinus sp. 2_MG-2023]MBU2885602.1 hypothetical protein [Gilvimarinus agarilyticus]MDO6570469.1 hypothetical protein [Gilvimarinus sp. 2_MG-2023]
MTIWKPLLTATLAASATLLIGCSDTGPESSQTSSASACLLDAAQSPCDLLTIERARTVFPMLPEKIDINENLTKYSSSCRISWQTGRKSTVGSGNFAMEVDVDDALELSNIRQVNADTFIRQHRTLSDEEKAQAAKQAAQAVDAKAKDGTIDKKHVDMGKDFAKSLVNKMQWDPVTGLGDQAAWGGVGRFKTLNVLLGDAMFSVRAEVSNEETKTLEASKLAAQMIVDTCQ